MLLANSSLGTQSSLSIANGEGTPSARMNSLGGLAALLLFCALVPIAAGAQSFTTLVHFNWTNGARPTGALIQGLDGDFYGTTPQGGEYIKGVVSGPGTIFRVTPEGQLTTIQSLSFATGFDQPNAGLVLAANGNFFGTTFFGGTSGYGTLFEITPAGEITLLYDLCSQPNCADGSLPYAPLMQASNGNLYGTTTGGGLGGGSEYGTIFEVASDGTFTTLYRFCSLTNCMDGFSPEAGLMQGSDGNLYGTTEYGGSGYYGTVFKLTYSGVLTTLYDFCIEGQCPDGGRPYGGLVQAANSNFYGTTAIGGTRGLGTVFEITPEGQLTTLYNFCSVPGCPDGAVPLSGLVQATDGNFYGTTLEGGVDGNGTIFRITPSGKLTTLHRFIGSDGGRPSAALVQATNGNFFGSTSQFGLNGAGTLFSLSVGLDPFVKTQPASAKTGSDVIIRGSNLTHSTRVTFNGAEANYTVVSATEISARVPAGATSGKVRVAMSSGKVLMSDVVFRVAP